MKNRRLPVVALALLLIGGLTALVAYTSSKRAAAPAGTGKPVVEVTFYPLYDIVRNVAGDAAEVRMLMPPGANPHTYEPTPSSVRGLNEAVVVYAIGHGIDDWVDPLLAGGGPAKVTLDKGIPLRQATSAEEGGGVDPHFWLDVGNAEIMARDAAEDLSGRVPGKAAEFRANLAEYLPELESADAQVRSILAGVANRDLVTLHDAWYYFAAAYGLNIAGTFEPTAGREPTPQYLAALTKAVRTAKVKTLYTEPFLPTATIEPFVRDNGLKLVELNPAEGSSAESYIDIMLSDARTIAENQ